MISVMNTNATATNGNFVLMYRGEELPVERMAPYPPSEQYPKGYWRLFNEGDGHDSVIFDAREITRFRRPGPVFRWDGYEYTQYHPEHQQSAESRADATTPT